MPLRTPLTVQPHLYIGDPNGRPLDYGIIYFGEPNKDPEFYPINVYLDAEMTIAAAQPVRTQAGFVMYGGDLAELHAEEVIYSIKVLDKDRRQIFYKPEMYRNNVSDFLQDEILRATEAEDVLTTGLTDEIERATSAENIISGSLSTEITRATNAEQTIDNKFTQANAILDSKITSVAGGKKSYTTYAKMTGAAALPAGDLLKLPANSSVDVIADSDSTKNGTYDYDGTTFTKSVYDPIAQAQAYTNLAITTKADKIRKSLYSDFVQGYVNIAGDETASTIQLRSPVYKLSVGTVINFDRLNADYNFGVGFSNSSKVGHDSSKWDTRDTGKYTITADNPYVRFFIRKKAGTTITVAEGLSAIEAYTTSQVAYISDLGSASADTKIVSDVQELQGRVDYLYRGHGLATTDLLKTTTLTAGRFIGATGSTVANTSYSYTDYMAVKEGDEYTISVTSNAVGAFYDSNKTFLAAIKSTPTAPDGLERNFEFKAPASAAFMRINIIKDMQVTLVDSTQDVSFGTSTGAAPTQWKDKNIYWFGTSIPAGSPHATQRDVWSYANLATKDVGGIIHNKSVGSSGIASYTDFSFTNLTSAVNYKNALVDMIGTATAPDLVVFDFGVNDYATRQTDIDAYDPLDPYDLAATGTKTKIDSRDTATFIGAYNTIIDAMLTKSPTVKFCFITHFSDDNAATFITKKDNYYAKMNLTIAAIAAYWSAPVLELQKKTNFRNRNGFNSIEPLMPDRIHPASGDGAAVASLRNIVRDFLISIA